MDSTSTIPQIATAQASKEVQANALFAAASPSMAYGLNPDTTLGLVFGYLGKRIDATTLVANGTHTCTASTTVYFSVLKSDGSVNFSTSSTNWDDHTNYGQAYKITAGLSSLTYVDCRGGTYGVNSTGAVGAGDMILSAAQTVTGKKIFGAPGAVGKFAIAGTTSGSVIIDVPAVAGSGTIVTPLTGTLATLSGAEALTNKTYEGMTFAGTGTMTFPGASASIGYLNVPQNAQTGSYTTVLADSGKHIYHASGAGSGDTYTIAANGSVAYALGTAITFVNLDSNTVSIAITTDTMYLGGTGTTGTRTLAQYGVATALKVDTTTWVISGTGLT